MPSSGRPDAARFSRAQAIEVFDASTCVTS
jgi:hypothetical protein